MCEKNFTLSINVLLSNPCGKSNMLNHAPPERIPKLANPAIAPKMYFAKLLVRVSHLIFLFNPKMQTKDYRNYSD